jgi:2-dehydropantoate 2-reductase
MGTGGVGGYLGGRLTYAGLDVTFIARGVTLNVLRESGLQVHSHKGDFATGPVQTTGNPAEVGPVDLILFCVKAYDADHAMQLIRPMIGPETAVVPVLNGIEHIPRLQTTLGKRHVLGGMSLISTHKGAPGVIHHVADAGNQLDFGEWTGEVSPRCEKIQATLKQAGVTAMAVPNISERMWWKLAGICGVSVFAVMRGDKATVWAPETAALVRQAVAEAVAVAHTQKVPLANTLPDDIVKIADNLPPNYKPSLLVDLENGNRLEVEAMSGAVARLGKEAGVPTPVNDFIYACLKPYVNGMPQ